jgi:hypothetical protein
VKPKAKPRPKAKRKEPTSTTEQPAKKPKVDEEVALGQEEKKGEVKMEEPARPVESAAGLTAAPVENQVEIKPDLGALPTALPVEGASEIKPEVKDESMS